MNRQQELEKQNDKLKSWLLFAWIALIHVAPIASAAITAGLPMA